MLTTPFGLWQLCNEDYNWWWRSFMCSGSCALYIFLYSIWYLTKELDIEGTSLSFATPGGSCAGQALVYISR